MKKLLGIAALNCLMLTAGSTPVRPDANLSPMLEESVRRNLRLAAEEASQGNFRRAQAYASLSAVPSQLSVYMDATGLDVSRAADLQVWAGSALSAWEDTGLIRFSTAPSLEQADVVIQFKDAVMRNGLHAGYITSHRFAHYGDYGVTVELCADVEIADRTPSGRLMNHRQIRKAVMHEIGHMLGLEDSRNWNDVMGPVGNYPADSPVDAKYVEALLQMDSVAQSYLATEAVVAQSSSVPMSTPQVKGYVPKVFTFAEPR